jgi:hypothetical protein
MNDTVCLEFIKTICNKRSKKKASVDTNQVNYFTNQRIIHFDNIQGGIFFYIRTQPGFKDLPGILIDSLIGHD